MTFMKCTYTSLTNRSTHSISNTCIDTWKISDEGERDIILPLVEKVIKTPDLHFSRIQCLNSV